jgi:vancomycin resistance protein YoaR
VNSVRKSRFHPSRRGWALIAVLALLLSSYTADSVAAIGRVRSGVEAGSLQLGGRTVEAARSLLVERARLLTGRGALLYADSRRESVSPAEVQFTPEVEPTLAAAMAVGRQGNVFVRLWQRLRSLFAKTDVGWRSSLDRAAADRLVSAWARDIDTEGHEAGIQAIGAHVVAVGPVPGRRLDRSRAVSAIVFSLEHWPRASVELPIQIVRRHTDLADARRAADEANSWLRDSVHLFAPDGTRILLTPTDLATMIEAVPRRHGRDWSLQVRFSPQRVAVRLGERMTQYETEARSATFTVEGGTVSVVPSVEGRRFDPAATAAELGRAAASDGARTAYTRFASVKPDLTTDAAKALNIHELVSSYTTYYPCCASRVINIHKIADIVDGAVLRPGEQFSLNGYVGPRTSDKGFVLAPMIADGKYKDDTGGGVSQFATTTFNAVFYGGYEIDYHQAHSYYISRYPAGRDATVSWPAPDLRFTDNSHSGILIKTSYTATSVTVSFYGDKEGKVVTDETGPRTNYTDPKTQYEDNPDVPAGQQQVKQAGERGFDIEVIRVITQNGHTTRQRFFTRYDAEPRIIEVPPGTAHCANAAASPTPEATPCPSPSAAPASPGPVRTPAPAAPPDSS